MKKAGDIMQDNNLAKQVFKLLNIKPLEIFCLKGADDELFYLTDDLYLREAYSGNMSKRFNINEILTGKTVIKKAPLYKYIHDCETYYAIRLEAETNRPYIEFMEFYSCMYDCLIDRYTGNMFKTNKEANENIKSFLEKIGFIDEINYNI